MPEDFSIRVDGLRDLTKALGDVSPELRRELTRALKKGVQQSIPAVRREAPQGRSRKGHRAGALRRSIRPAARASSQNVSAEVRLGGDSTPYAGWIEFGGRIVQHKRRRIIQREHKPEGRFFWPTMTKRVQPIFQDMVREVEGLLRRKGLM
jgi:HK97 gp10 family phage protein